jgi:hypothetical protein
MPNSAIINNNDLPSTDGDNLNLEQYRFAQDFSAVAIDAKALTTIRVGKPSKDMWFQTHPDLGYRLPTPVIELKDAGELYLVDRALWASLQGEPTFVPKVMVPAITRQGTVFIWPIRLPDADGQIDSWSASAMAAADGARGKWTRMCANREARGYDIRTAAIGQTPIWPEKTLADLLSIAFKSKVISDAAHPVLRNLRGE